MPITVTNLTWCLRRGDTLETTALRDVSVTVEKTAASSASSAAPAAASPRSSRILAGLSRRRPAPSCSTGRTSTPAAMTAAFCGARSASCSSTRALFRFEAQRLSAAESRTRALGAETVVSRSRRSTTTSRRWPPVEVWRVGHRGRLPRGHPTSRRALAEAFLQPPSSPA